MSNRPVDRAEARRRARLAARGELADEEPVGPEPTNREAGGAAGGLLRRMFPPAPPLPGRPDPLEDFTYTGVLRPVVSRLYLLARNPLSWAVPAAIWFASRLVDPQSVLGLFGALLSFAALIGAGWFGWQRPTLYGTTAAVVGFVAYVAWIFWFFSSMGVAPGEFGTPSELISGLTVNGLLQAGLGFVAGWYGGYLRRRQAQGRRVTGQRPRR